MTSLNCTLEVNEPESKILLRGLKEEAFYIDYSGDVDFTPLVSLLTECIDNDKNVELVNVDNEGLSEKTILVKDTLVNIIKSYNKCINEFEGLNQEII